jgi:hypothetical protein
LPFYDNLAEAASTAAGIEEFARSADEQPNCLTPLVVAAQLSLWSEYQKHQLQRETSQKIGS